MTHVAMESTGEYWKPVFNILEPDFQVLLVNAQHVKAVTGRKTDVNDAQWIADLLKHGLLCASFVPPQGQRQLRELTRHRTNFVQERSTLINRIQKVLESANLKLSSVASNVVGVSGRAMLQALIEGNASPDQMAELAKGQLQKKRDQLTKALQGRVQPHHRFVLTELLCQIEGLEETIAHFDQEIEKCCTPFQDYVGLLDTIPGVARQTAEVIVSENGNVSTQVSLVNTAKWAQEILGRSPHAFHGVGMHFGFHRHHHRAPIHADCDRPRHVTE